MLLLDSTILVYSFRADSPDHELYRVWLQRQMETGTTLAVSHLALSDFLRVVTHPKIFDPPAPVDQTLEFVDALFAYSGTVRLNPADRHWDIFVRLCRQTEAAGNAVTDAFHAALAIETGCEWITADRAFSRFPGLRWRTPF